MKFFLHMFFLSCLAITSIFPANADEIGIPKVLPSIHTAKIADLAVIKDGKGLISASKDGVIHIWDLSNGGKIIQSIYTSKGEYIYAMAVSPDESEFIVSGYMTLDERYFYLKVYDLNTGEIKHIVEAHSNIINSLEYSQDGNYVVSSSTDRNLVIWNTKDWSKEILLKGHSSGVDNAKFVNTVPAVVSASEEGEIYYWQLSKEAPKRLLREKETKNHIQTSIAVSKDNNRIAIGRSDFVHIFDRKGDLEKKIEISNGKVTEVNLSNDGNYLFVATIKSYALLKINIKTRKTEQTYRCKGVSTGCKAIITSVFNSQTRDGFLLGDMEGNIYNWNTTEPEVVGGYLNLAGITKVGFSSEKRLIWSVGETSSFYGMSLDESSTGFGDPNKLEEAPSVWNGARLHKYNNLKLERYDGGSTLDVYRDKKRIGRIVKDSSTGFIHSSYTFLIDGEYIVSGGNDGLLAQYDLEGNIEGKYIGHFGDIQSLAVSKDGKYLISGAADNMLKIWSIETKEEIVSVFHDSKGRWVMWTPSGYYTASANGHEIFGWLFDSGVNEKVDFVNASQVSDKFYHPEIVEKVLAGMLVNSSQIVSSDIGLLPQFKVIYPQDKEEVDTSRLNIEIAMENTEEVKIYVNGKYIDDDKLKGFSRLYEKEIELRKGKNTVKIVGYNNEGSSIPKQFTVVYRGNEEKREYEYDALNLVAIGANGGDTNQISKLNFADDDVIAFSDFYRSKEQSKLAENRNNIHLLASEGNIEPTKANIINALDAYSEASSNDLNILYLSGHGVNVEGEYYFVPDNYRNGAKGYLNTSTLVKWKDIEESFVSAKGTRILFIDTCYSGASGKSLNKIINLMGGKSIIVYSATDSKSKAQEMPSLKRGVFSDAVLKSLTREIDDYKYKGDIVATELMNVIDNLVPMNTANKQIPYSVLAGSRTVVAKGE